MADSSSGRVTERKRHSPLVEFLTRLVKEKPLGTMGAVITLLLLFTGIFANFLAPYQMGEIHRDYIMIPPSAKFWLGTDNMGRDLLTRVIYGARISVIIGLSTSSLATAGAAFLGIASGYIGGKFDLVVQRFVDAVMCFPGLLILMIIIAMIGPGMTSVIFVLAVRWAISGSRIMRSAVISIKENVYVDAAIAIGCSTPRILSRHILPQIIPLLVINFSIQVPLIILTEAALSFLGYGIPPPAPSWGGMLSGAGREYMLVAPWMVIWPGLALSIVVYGVNMFGDAVRDLLDPRLRGGVGRYGVRVKKVAAVKSEPSNPEGLTK